jgi:pimeloyl-ACP methyl ester carboxylesterase
MQPLTVRALLAIVVLALSGCAEDVVNGAGPSGPLEDAGEDAGEDSGADSGADAGESSTGPIDDDAGVAEAIELQVGDYVFDALVQGPEDGEVVFLLHGFPETSYEWRSQLPVLASAGYRAVAPNQRGYSAGARPEDVADYEMTFLVDDVLRMADELGVERFHLVGHDWGAAVAWVVAVTAPERLISLTTLSVPHPDAFATVLADMTSCQYSASAYFDFFVMPTSQTTILANDAAFFRDALLGTVDEAVVDQYLAVLGTEEALGAALNWYRANVAGRMFDAPSRGPIDVPTLFIWSDGDTALCRDGADLTEQYVNADYQFEVLEGVDHWIADHAPDALNTLLLEHLAAHGAD